jgi:hypothetical protein
MSLTLTAGANDLQFVKPKDLSHPEAINVKIEKIF